MKSFDSRTPPSIVSYGRAKSKAWRRRAVLFCASAILCALAIHIMAHYGFNAVVKCEMEDYRLLHRSGAVTTEIVAANACGF